MNLKVITAADANHLLSWEAMCAAISAGHKRPKAVLGDQFLPTTNGTMMARAASIKGIGAGVKSITVTPENAAANLPSVQGAMIVFDEQTGTPRAIIDSALITNWKTVADSLLGAQLLANPEPKSLLIVGAGTVAANLIDGYCAIFPSIEKITIWTRTFANAQKLAAAKNHMNIAINATDHLADACSQADITSAATLTQEPIIMGEWIAPGTHVDLIGAFKTDMRESDDALLQKSRIFVDSFETTIDHIGELKIPLAFGAIKRSDVVADFYDLVPGNAGRQSSDEITLFKNGGGAHLDLMIANAILDLVS